MQTGLSRPNGGSRWGFITGHHPSAARNVTARRSDRGSGLAWRSWPTRPEPSTVALPATRERDRHRACDVRPSRGRGGARAATLWRDRGGRGRRPRLDLASDPPSPRRQHTTEHPARLSAPRPVAAGPSAYWRVRRSWLQGRGSGRTCHFSPAQSRCPGYRGLERRASGGLGDDGS